MNMNCPLKSNSSSSHDTVPDAIEVLLDYSAGKLDRARSEPLERHVSECSDCSAFLSGQAQVWRALDLWEPEPVSMDFNRRLWQKIDAAAAAPWYRKLADSLSMGAWKPVLPLTAAVFMVATAFMMDHRGAVSVSPAPAVSMSDGVSVTEAEQVEKTLDDLQLLRQLDAGARAESNSSPM